MTSQLMLMDLGDATVVTRQIGQPVREDNPAHDKGFL
jgi:hypothetical protein